jgi:hypothetical protein
MQSEVTMKRIPQASIIVLASFCTFATPSVLYARTSYPGTGIASIGVGQAGEMYIRLQNFTFPQMCPAAGGNTNNNWVQIPATNDAMKSLALSLYFSGKSTLIVTDICNGPYETVIELYSPS